MLDRWKFRLHGRGRMLLLWMLEHPLLPIDLLHRIVVLLHRIVVLLHGSVVGCEVERKGVSISVWRKPDRTRELILDFPFSLFKENRSPGKKSLLAVLPPAIQAAIEAGWDPDSRGCTFRFNVPETAED